MAMAKCDAHGPPIGRSRSYEFSVRPDGFPNLAVLCNASGCLRPALIWLDAEEAAGYANGRRVFDAISAAFKLGVE